MHHSKILPKNLSWQDYRILFCEHKPWQHFILAKILPRLFAVVPYLIVPRPWHNLAWSCKILSRSQQDLKKKPNTILAKSLSWFCNHLLMKILYIPYHDSAKILSKYNHELVIILPWSEKVLSIFHYDLANLKVLK